MSPEPPRSRAAEAFHDTNIVLSLASSDQIRADIAEALIARGGHVSVQVLNEFASIATRKFGMPWAAVDDVIDAVRQVCQVHALTLETHERARAIAQRHGLVFDDALVVAAALLAGCEILYSADLRVDRTIARLTIRNPFPPPRAATGSARSSILRPAHE
jgi:predicted nucleic acid-binding protein